MKRFLVRCDELLGLRLGLKSEEGVQGARSMTTSLFRIVLARDAIPYEVECRASAYGRRGRRMHAGVGAGWGVSRGVWSVDATRPLPGASFYPSVDFRLWV